MAPEIAGAAATAGGYLVAPAYVTGRAARAAVHASPPSSGAATAASCGRTTRSTSCGCGAAAIGVRRVWGSPKRPTRRERGFGRARRWPWRHAVCGKRSRVARARLPAQIAIQLWQRYVPLSCRSSVGGNLNHLRRLHFPPPRNPPHRPSLLQRATQNTTHDEVRALRRHGGPGDGRRAQVERGDAVVHVRGEGVGGHGRTLSATSGSPAARRAPCWRRTGAGERVAVIRSMSSGGWQQVGITLCAALSGCALPTRTLQAWLSDFAPRHPGTKEAFAENLARIIAHNADATATWKAGVNQWTGLTCVPVFFEPIFAASSALTPSRAHTHVDARHLLSLVCVPAAAPSSARSSRASRAAPSRWARRCRTTRRRRCRCRPSPRRWIGARRAS